MKQLISILLSAVVCMSALAQTTLDWNLGFRSVFDNREGEKKYVKPQTIFFTELTPEIGLGLGQSDRIAGGVVWTHPLSGSWDGTRVRPTLYYRHHGNGEWSGSFGIFPRTHLIESMPSFMWSSSDRYYNANITGALLQWQRGRSFAEIFLDWRQRQTETEREHFTVTAHGRWQGEARAWMAGAYLMMNHLALSKLAPEGMHIVDNFMAIPYVGADWSSNTALDELRVRLGAAITIERNREFGKWEVPAGAWLEATAGLKGFRLRNMLYVGGHLFPSWNTFGSELYYGTPYFAAKFYDHAELSYGIVRRAGLELRAGVNFHITPGSVMSYQKLSLVVHFGDSYPLRLKMGK